MRFEFPDTMAACPDCGESVESAAERCPVCGAAVQYTGSLPPEASPMFGGGTWRGTDRPEDLTDRTQATQEQADTDGTSPEDSPMFGGGTWRGGHDTDQSVDADNEPTESETSTHSRPSRDDSPMFGGGKWRGIETSTQTAGMERTQTTVVRDILLYTTGALAVVGAWYLYF